MEYCSGGDLFERMIKIGTFNEKMCSNLLEAIIGYCLLISVM